MIHVKKSQNWIEPIDGSILLKILFRFIYVFSQFLRLFLSYQPPPQNSFLSYLFAGSKSVNKIHHSRGIFCLKKMTFLPVVLPQMFINRLTVSIP